MPEPKSATRTGWSSFSGDEVSAWLNTSMNLLICFHLRDIDGISACLRIGHAQVGEKRSAQVKEAIFLAVVLGRRRLTQLLRLAFEQRAFALLAVFQLGLVGQRQQVRVLERRRQQLGNRRHAFGHGEVLGDVTGLVAVDEGQARLPLDLTCLMISRCSSASSPTYLASTNLMKAFCARLASSSSMNWA